MNSGLSRKIIVFPDLRSRITVSTVCVGEEIIDRVPETLERHRTTYARLRKRLRFRFEDALSHSTDNCDRPAYSGAYFRFCGAVRTSLLSSGRQASLRG